MYVYVYVLCVVCDVCFRFGCELCDNSLLRVRPRLWSDVAMKFAIARLLTCKTKTWRQYSVDAFVGLYYVAEVLIVFVEHLCLMKMQQQINQTSDNI